MPVVTDEQVKKLMSDWLACPLLVEAERTVTAGLQHAISASREVFDIVAADLWSIHPQILLNAVIKARMMGIGRRA